MFFFDHLNSLIFFCSFKIESMFDFFFGITYILLSEAILSIG